MPCHPPSRDSPPVFTRPSSIPLEMLPRSSLDRYEISIEGLAFPGSKEGGGREGSPIWVSSFFSTCPDGSGPWHVPNHRRHFWETCLERWNEPSRAKRWHRRILERFEKDRESLQKSEGTNTWLFPLGTLSCVDDTRMSGSIRGVRGEPHRRMEL